MWKPTRGIGTALGDRACLALALKTSVPAFTTEEAWSKCELGVQIVKIR
jgi:PIN domain nuclease of toxin-antitoxin system